MAYLLNSWKEIAEYVGGSVRTVQRWEAERGLPVRRPSGRPRTAVLAIASEIDDWLRGQNCSDAVDRDQFAQNLVKQAL
jgi:phage terminase Nu1 subunit (DNA packaging protein)